MTPLTPRIAVVLLVVAGICAPVHATITAFWRQNTITQDAINADPSLATHQSWSLMVQNPENEGFWHLAGLRATLSLDKSYYRVPLGGFTRPSAAAIAANPALEFHTYVTSPRQSPSGANPPTLISNFPTSGTPSLDGFLFSVYWGDGEAQLGPVLGGPFEICRLTFPQGVIPLIFWDGNPPMLPLSSNTTQLDPAQTTIIPRIPEPVALSLLTAAWGLLSRARRS